MPNTPDSNPRWALIVEQIQAGSESAVEELYRSLRSIRLNFVRQLGPDHADDAYHNLIIDVVRAIRAGSIRNPETLAAFAQTIARRKAIACIGEVIRDRQNVGVGGIELTDATLESPEQYVIRAERESIAKRVLMALPPTAREVLVRFYLDGESREEILVAMGLTDTQFRLIKSRAKARYTELMQQSLSRVAIRKPVKSAHEISRQAIA
jgi:RNA polymerase sigma-70 factor, ECF subfamily